MVPRSAANKGIRGQQGEMALLEGMEEGQDLLG